MSADPSPPPRIVLDTNVCLDLFVFHEPQSAALHVAMQCGTIEAVTRADCRDEWLRVLRYPQLPVTDATRPMIEASFDALVRCLPDEFATAPGAAPLPRCADPDDQKFLELAQASGARWLVSKDNELLKLAPRCARDALFWIGLPQAWSPRKA
ncbi:putative toxin-antitoxin system toxin component, PIN family [Rhodanobacter denitrificans]|uniref:Putative toxin-antitoxin system toxin component, PIN family n=1 Tax=Rhodanobacter denitrificans TaxID=666685 RepID=A0A368KAB3_9GAMM|nr:putative toxin-antitoxin system toxin component, PIN family [Rhodanobacter denitrificans]RCS28879.1 putative toxin-antitoxin system toxin component, PIN family [Rhodanobacter denitrificans]